MEGDVRSEFTTHISALVTLHNSLLDKVKELEGEVEAVKSRHEKSKQLLVSTMNKRSQLSEEVVRLKNEVKRLNDEVDKARGPSDEELVKEVDKWKALCIKTKAKQEQWHKVILGYQEFKKRCTCQSKGPNNLLDFEEDMTPNKASTKAVPCARSTPINSPVVPSNQSKNSPTAPSNQSKSAVTIAPSNQSKNSSKSKKSTNPMSSNPFNNCSSPTTALRSNPSKRLRRSSPAGSQKVRYTDCTPPKPNITVYADDSQDSPEIESLLKQSRLEQSFANAPTVKLRTQPSAEPPNSPIVDEECQSPVILDQDWAELEMFETPVVTKQPRKFNILTEFNGDVSISEEKLGFSLPSTCPADGPSIAGSSTATAVKKDAKSNRVSTTTHTTTAPTTSKDFKFEAVVRKKEDRLKMKGSDCPLCVRYYEACGLPPDEIKRLIGDVTRHRHMHDKGGDTPPGYWDMTVTEGMVTQPATQKKARKKNKYFNSRKL